VFHVLSNVQIYSNKCNIINFDFKNSKKYWKQLALIALQGPDSMVTTNAVKIQLAGTLQMHVGVAD